jgi:hypothetical protein
LLVIAFLLLTRTSVKRLNNLGISHISILGLTVVGFHYYLNQLKPSYGNLNGNYLGGYCCSDNNNHGQIRADALKQTPGEENDAQTSSS